MSIIDKANKYIGHPREVDEGYEVSMRRDAYAQGYQDATNWLYEQLRNAEKRADYVGGNTGVLR